MYPICMKRHTTLSVDNDLMQRAKDKDINISELTEKAIKNKLGEVDVIIDTTIEKCQFCFREGEKETVEDIKPETNTRKPVEHPTLLTWLWPDEKWICNACLRNEARKVPASIAFT